MKLSTLKEQSGARVVEYGHAAWWEVPEIRRRVLFCAYPAQLRPFGRSRPKQRNDALLIALNLTVLLCAILVVAIATGGTS
jgi:hypothetical protein